MTAKRLSANISPQPITIKKGCPMTPQRSPRRWGLWTLSDALDIAIWLAAIAAVAIGCAGMASAQEKLDISILAKLDAPAAQAPRDALDLSLLDRLDAPVATAGESLDLTLLDELDAKPGKPAVKPSKAAMRSLGAASGVELGCEIGRESCRPEMPQASLSGVNLKDTTVNPPNGRIWNRPDDAKQALIEHLIGHPNHSPHGFTFNVLNQLDLQTLERLHSNDHDHRLNLSTKTIAEAPRPSAATQPKGASSPVPASTGKLAGMTPTTGTASPPSWGGTRFYWPSRGAWYDSPEPGMNYPEMGGVLVPLGSVQSAPQASRPIVIRGNCPNGVCPLR